MKVVRTRDRAEDLNAVINVILHLVIQNKTDSGFVEKLKNKAEISNVE